jgi:chitinase
MKRMLALLVLLCLASQISASLPGFPVTPRVRAAAHQVETSSTYIVSAAYPFWRASTFPPEAIPFEYLHQIGHHSVMPGEHGNLNVPDGFMTPQLIELAHEAGTEAILGIGGASSYQAFAAVVADTEDRAAFVQNVTAFVLNHGYDGVNIDWEAPKTPSDRQNLTALLAELRASLDASGRDLCLSVAVTKNEKRGEWIDVEAITPLVDHYVVMTFGYYGAWGSTSGHHAPLYSPPLAAHARSVDQSLRYWTETRGVPPSKILMGLASFGIWFDSEGLYQPFGDSRKSDYTEIKPLVAQGEGSQGYTRHWDGTSQVPFLTRDAGPGLWSYDDPRSVAEKRDYVLANGLGGVAVWDVTMDLVDGEHELLRALAHKVVQERAYVPLVQMGKKKVSGSRTQDD